MQKYIIIIHIVSFYLNKSQHFYIIFVNIEKVHKFLSEKSTHACYKIQKNTTWHDF